MLGVPSRTDRDALEGFVLSPLDKTPLYYEGSRGVEPPLVLLDGIGCDGYIWRPLRDALGEQWIVHPHYRGHGRSRLPVSYDGVQLADLAADSWSVLSSGCPTNKAVLVGHSMGVQVALEMWVQAPQRVAGMVLINGVAGNPLRTFRYRAIEKQLPAIRRLVMKHRGLLNWVSQRLLPTSIMYELATKLEIPRQLVSEAAFMPYLRGMSLMDTGLFVALLDAMATADRRDVLPSINIPTLIIAGTHDGFTPAQVSQEMAAAIPGSEFLLIEGGTHTTPVEHPIRIASAVTRFLARCEG